MVIKVRHKQDQASLYININFTHVCTDVLRPFQFSINIFRYRSIGKVRLLR